MKIKTLRKMSKDQFATAPQWFEPMYGIINDVVDALNNVMTKNVSLGDNLRAEAYTANFVHNTATTVRLRTFITSAPKLALVSYADGKLVTGSTITKVIANNEVEVTITFSDAPSAAVPVTLYFIG